MNKKLLRVVIALMTVISFTILPAFAVIAATQEEPPIPRNMYDENTPYSHLPIKISPKDTTPELTVEQTTDKTNYGETDSITVTLSLKNTSEHGSFVQNVKLSLKTPNGYLLANGDKAETILDVLEAGETAILKTTFISKKANPKTGDNNSIFWIIGIFVISGGIIVLFIRSKKIREIFLPMFVGFIVAGCLLVATTTKAFAGEDKLGEIEKSTTVKVNNKDLTINGLVTYDEWVVMPGKGDLITLDEQGAQFRVLKTNGTQAEVLSLEVSEPMVFNTTNNTITKQLPDGTPFNFQLYNGSSLDNYLNGDTDGCYYHGLSENIKNAIIPQNIDQYAYIWSVPEIPQEKRYPYWTGSYADQGKLYTYYIEHPGISENVGLRKVYALDIADVMEYLGDENLVPNNLTQMFFNTTTTDYTSWLRSTSYTKNLVEPHIFYAYGHYSAIDSQNFNFGKIRACGAFTIDLSKCTWNYIS